MHISETDERPLKLWLERRLSKLSDAEAPILAEYCIALLKHDQSQEEVRKLCIDQLKDFLTGDTEGFVDDILSAMDRRSFLPRNSEVGINQTHETSQPIPSQSIHQSPQYTEQKHVDGQNERSAVLATPLPTIHNSTFPEYKQNVQQPSRSKKRKPCFVFVREGYCPRAGACPYDHSAPARRNLHEYDPRYSSMSSNFSTSRAAEEVNPISVPNQVATRHERDSLMLSSIPPISLNESSIRRHFSAFGTISRLKLHPGESAASISFQDCRAAEAAYKSPLPIFNNRFVSVRWAPGTSPPRSVAALQVPASITNHNSQDLSSKLHEEKLKRNLEMQYRSAALAERRTELASKQQEQQAIISRLEQSHLPPQTSTSNTESLRSQLEQLKSKAAALGIMPENLSSQSRSESFTRRNSSVHGGHVQKRQQIATGRRNPGVYKNHVRSLDLRPKCLLIESDIRPVSEIEKEVRQSCNYDEIVVNTAPVMVAFKTRYEAEAFSSRRSMGKMTWVSKDAHDHVEERKVGSVCAPEEDINRYVD